MKKFVKHLIDTHTVKVIQEALKRLLADGTGLLIIMRRLSTITLPDPKRRDRSCRTVEQSTHNRAVSAAGRVLRPVHELSLLLGGDQPMNLKCEVDSQAYIWLIEV